jgi:hypothetical protein
MLTLRFPRGSWGSPGGRTGVIWLSKGGVVVLLALASSAVAQDAGAQAKSKSGQAQPGAAGLLKGGQTKAAPGGDAGKTNQEKSAKGKEKDEPGKADSGGDTPADPSKTTKTAPIEIFRDPRADKLLDVRRFTATPPRAIEQSDIKALVAMALDPNANVNANLINNVVDAMVAQLTDHGNIQALIDPPANLSPNSPKFKAIHEATKALQEPLYSAKSAKNEAFLRAYNRVLLQKLAPLLKNHLIPRTEASIVLGQSGNPDALRLFEDQIKDERQTFWVKLWAMEGISNILKENRVPASDRIVAGKIIADFLKNEDDIPWPVQFRAVETLGALRQGFRANAPKDAEMATAAMRLLTEFQAKPEVRAEAARSLGLMEVTAIVPGYNYGLIAHAAGQLAADLGAQIGSSFKNNPVKSRALTVLLAGPIYQAFDGVPGMRDSGIVHLASDDQLVAGVFEMIKPLILAASELLASPSRQVPERQKELAAKVDNLKQFLTKNQPKSRSLVRGGPQFPAGDKAAPGLPG